MNYTIIVLYLWGVEPTKLYARVTVDIIYSFMGYYLLSSYLQFIEITYTCQVVLISATQRATSIACVCVRACVRVYVSLVVFYCVKIYITAYGSRYYINISMLFVSILHTRDQWWLPPWRRSVSTAVFLRYIDFPHLPRPYRCLAGFPASIYCVY